MPPTSPHSALDAFTAPVAQWFQQAFSSPTPAQIQGWPAIAAGHHTLIAAPTGSGKTLAAFLWGINQTMSESVPDKEHRTRLLYLSPLRALANDINKNLRQPLDGISEQAKRLNFAAHLPTIGLRTGDTPPSERRRLVTHPPDILITTPESLYLMLTSRARETLRSVRWVIVDEIHSLAGTKRGSHLAVSLERLGLLTQQGGQDSDGHGQTEPQRIALSATQRPLSEVAEFLGGWSPTAATTRANQKRGNNERANTVPPNTVSTAKRRPVEIVKVGDTKHLDVEVLVPNRDMGNLASSPTDGSATAGAGAANTNSIWPSIHSQLLDLILAHRCTIIFVNARRLAERLASRLNELHAEGVNRANEGFGTGQADPAQAGSAQASTGSANTGFVRAHHGSLSLEQRLEIETALKQGTLRAIVSTSSLELGIDMGAVDLVIQVESPGSVSSGVQRIGRAGHQVGEPSVGKIFPSHRNDLIETAVVVNRMRTGLIEQTRYLRQPLDVLAQQIVAMAAMDDWDTAELLAVLRQTAPYQQLSQSVFESVLDLLAGRYPSQEFAELRPRIVWDRIAGTIRPRQGAARLAVTSGGTIADRGLFAVFTLTGSRVGELDEEMVYEARAGETFLLGASSWRIEEITHDRVLVSPAPGVPAKMPFWHGGGPGRPLELGRAVGEFLRQIADAMPPALSPDVATALRDQLYLTDGEGDVAGGAAGGGASTADNSAGTAGNSAGEVAIGALNEELADLEPLLSRLQSEYGLNRCAAVNLLLYVDEQRAATGAIPDDRTIIVERFRDEIGDWRICVLTPFGAQVHAPWAIAMQAQLEGAAGSGADATSEGSLGEGALDGTSNGTPADTAAGPAVDILWNDDGIVLRLPATDTDTEFATDYETGPAAHTTTHAGTHATTHATTHDLAALVSLDPDTITETIVSYLPSTALFASRFREVACRALLLPRRKPGQRTPLWQQRQRSSSLLEVASKYPDFPMLLETTRECMQDVFNVAALTEVLRDIFARKVRVVALDTRTASPMSQGLLFDWTAVFMYSGDMPLAERRAAALSLDQDLLADLLGPEELRELLDPEVLAAVAGELSRIRCGDADQLHDELRRLGDLSAAEITSRWVPAGEHTDRPDDKPTEHTGGHAIGRADEHTAVHTDGHTAAPAVADWLADLLTSRRACQVEIAGETRVIAAEDAIRYQDALGCALPEGLPAALTQPQPGVSPADHLAELVARFASTHTPFAVEEPADRFGVPASDIKDALAQLAVAKRVIAGSFVPGGTQSEWCDSEVLRTLRRRSLARLRRSIKPTSSAAYGRFLPVWHGVDRPRSGQDALMHAIDMLSGAPLVASTLETDVLPARVRDYQPADLDALLSSGELVWVGAGSLGAGALGARDGRIRLYWRSDFAALAPEPLELAALEPTLSESAPTESVLAVSTLSEPTQSESTQAQSTSLGSELVEPLVEPLARGMREAVRDAVRQVLLKRGSAFWPELLEAAISTMAAGAAGGGSTGIGASGDVGVGVASNAGISELVHFALWDLVWAGEITNDTLAPLRSLLTASPSETRRITTQGAQRSGDQAAQRRSESNRKNNQQGRQHSRQQGRQQNRRGPSFVGPKPARRRMRLSNRDMANRDMTNRDIANQPGEIANRSTSHLRANRGGGLLRSGPPSASGRWSSTAAVYQPRPAREQRAHYNALTLLHRHGVLTKAGVMAEQQPGGFASVYAVLRTLEERGEVRRGYFIDGLGAAQFASADAVELLRSYNEPDTKPADGVPTDGIPTGNVAAGDVAAGDVVVLAATDPAQPYGAALPWPPSPGRPTRRSGSLVVLGNGSPLIQLDSGGRGIQTFPGCRDVRWIEALRQRIRSGSIKTIELAKIDGQPAATHPLNGWLLANGFVSSYRGPALYR